MIEKTESRLLLLADELVMIILSAEFYFSGTVRSFFLAGE